MHYYFRFNANDTLINSFNEFKDNRKRIIFKIRIKRGLIAGKPEYEKFLQKMLGGEDDGIEGYQKKEFLSKNLFYLLNQLIVELDEIVSASQKIDLKNEGNSITSKPVSFERIKNDYLKIKEDFF